MRHLFSVWLLGRGLTVYYGKPDIQRSGRYENETWLWLGPLLFKTYQ